MRKFSLALLVVLAFCISAPSAQALNFANLPWASWAGDFTADFDTGLGYDIHFTALGGPLTWNANDGGVGVGDDEVGYEQALVIGFSKPVDVMSFELVDLFNEYGYLEKGAYIYDNGYGGSGYGFFEADENELIGAEGPDEGVLSLSINDSVKEILFAAVGDDLEFDHRFDFAVQGYTAAVTEPSTMALLGFGLIALAGLGRRKTKPKA